MIIPREAIEYEQNQYLTNVLREKYEGLVHDVENPEYPLDKNLRDVLKRMLEIMAAIHV